MLLILIGICILMIVIGIVINCKCYDTEWGEALQVIGFLLLAVVIAISLSEVHIIAQKPEYERKIQVYETEMVNIQNTVNGIVENYLDHEQDTYTALTPENAIVYASLYPELQSSSLVQKQLEIYNEYLISIKNCKLKLTEIPTARWWLYFGN